MWSNATYSLSQGDVLLIPEGTPHYLVSCQDAVALGIALCASCLHHAAGRLDFLSQAFRAVMRGASARRQLSSSTHAMVVGALENIEHELETSDSGHELVVEAELIRIAVAIHRASATIGSHEQSHGESLCSRALAFISANALDSISLADVARHVARSRSHTSDTVKRETGRSVTDWIAGSRLAVARQLMLDTDETIEAIAFRVGFASRSHFHRTFKRFHGHPPSAWRRAHRS
ncbi:MAG: AraC family transcriptional regulator [Acidobacteriota bacterium]